MASVITTPARRLDERGGLGRGRCVHAATQGYSIVEAVITLPVLVILVMIIIQQVMVWHGRHVAEAAAQTGLRAGRAYQATAAAGQSAAESYLHRVAPSLLTDPRVLTAVTPTTVTVQVHGRVTALIGFLNIGVDEQATGPREHFVPPSQR